MRLSSDSDPAEQTRIYDWIAADPAHAVAFAKAELVWEHAARIDARSLAAMPDMPPRHSYRRHPVRSFMLGGVTAVSLLLASSAMPLPAGTVPAVERCPSSKAP